MYKVRQLQLVEVAVLEVIHSKVSVGLAKAKMLTSTLAMALVIFSTNSLVAVAKVGNVALKRVAMLKCNYNLPFMRQFLALNMNLI